MGIEIEDITGLVRTNAKKGDENKDKPYTAVLKDGTRVAVDASTAKSMEKRFDKDRSKMERAGIVEKPREPEKREKNPVLSREQQLAWANSDQARNARRR
jgi:hypothetical protein